MPDSSSTRVTLTGCLLVSIPRYWLSVYPMICAERRCWRQRAEAIPNRTLRGLALEAQQVKRGNVDGAAALATFVPRRLRPTAVRAQVAFQSIYDYVDTLAEQPGPQPAANARQLHQSLLVALDPRAEHADYYAHQANKADDGYLRALVEACRSSLRTLPCHSVVMPQIRTCAERIVGYQSRNLTEAQGGQRDLERWAAALIPKGSGLRWWEAAASAGSSLGLFALIAAAARPSANSDEAHMIQMAYWPWIGALHSLLDSLTDQQEDHAAGQRSLLSYYRTRGEAASRLRLLTEEAKRAAAALPHAGDHTLILAAMTSHYLARATPGTLAATVSRETRTQLGPITAPLTHIQALRQAASSDVPPGSLEPSRRPMLASRVDRDFRRDDQPACLRPRAQETLVIPEPGCQ
jgi:tetraprenyl-beta-curcumene synthase